MADEKECESPIRDGLTWLALYRERCERFTKLVRLSAPEKVVATEAILVLHAIAHLAEGPEPYVGRSDSVPCVLRWLKDSREKAQKD